MNYNDIREKMVLDDKFRPLCEFFETVKDIIGVFIFGSYGTMAQNINSDIDLGILFNSEKTMWQLCDIQSKIITILGTDRVDVVNLGAADSILAFEIISSNRLIYCADREKVNNCILDFIKRYQHDNFRYFWASKLCLEVIGNEYKINNG